MYMTMASQLNLHMTPGFDKALAKFMRLKGIRTKSEAIRIAVQEGIERLTNRGKGTDFNTWIGAGTSAPLNLKRRFRDSADLWK